MAAPLDDAARVEHDDLVGVAYRRQPVGNDEHGTLPHQPLDGLLHEPLGLGIERAGGFIQDENRGVAQQGSGNGNALALAPRQPGAPLAEHGVVSLRECGNEGRCIRGIRRRLDLFGGCAGGAVGDVGADRVIEEHGILTHDAHQ
jgi:hypothetical protein